MFNRRRHVRLWHLASDDIPSLWTKCSDWNGFILYSWVIFYNDDWCCVFKVHALESHKLDVLRPLQWRHNEHDGVSNHQPHDCLLNRLFRRRSNKTSKLRVTGLCAGNLPVTGEFPAQRASNAENVSIWWRHHVENVSIWWRHHVEYTPWKKLTVCLCFVWLCL